jgi:uncharacterized protein (DUF2132 family)
VQAGLISILKKKEWQRERTELGYLKRLEKYLSTNRAVSQVIIMMKLMTLTTSVEAYQIIIIKVPSTLKGFFNQIRVTAR